MKGSSARIALCWRWRRLNSSLFVKVDLDKLTTCSTRAGLLLAWAFHSTAFVFCVFFFFVLWPLLLAIVAVASSHW